MASNKSDDDSSTLQIENQLKGLLKITSGLKPSQPSDPNLSDSMNADFSTEDEENANFSLNGNDDEINGTSDDITEETMKQPIVSKINNEHIQTIDLSQLPNTDCYSIYKENVKIISNPSASIKSNVPGSDKVKIQPITKFDWTHKYYFGNLLTISKNYIAYAIKTPKGFPIRVLNHHNLSDRVLLRGFNSEVCDVAFANYTSQLLAAVDQEGNFIIWKLTQHEGSTLQEKKLHVKASDTTTSLHHRIVWMPSMQCVRDIVSDAAEVGVSLDTDPDTNTFFTLIHGKNAEVWDLNRALQTAHAISKEVLTKQQLKLCYVTVEGHTDIITDCELSPDGGVVATSSHDGFIKFWQIVFENEREEEDERRVLHKFLPHDGKPVSAIAFFDNHMKAKVDLYWRFLLSGSDDNTELKIWCTVTWKCLQTINILPSPGPNTYTPKLKYGLHASADYLVLSDVMGKVLYVFRVATDSDEGNASLDAMTQYLLTSPLLSLAVIGARKCKFKVLDNVRVEDNEFQEEENATDNGRVSGVLIKIYSIHTKSLELLDVRFIPPSEDQPTSSSITTYNTSTEDINYNLSIDLSQENEASADEFEMNESGVTVKQDDVTLNASAQEPTKDHEEEEENTETPQEVPSENDLSKSMEASLVQSVMDLIGDVENGSNQKPSPISALPHHALEKEKFMQESSEKLLLPDVFTKPTQKTVASADTSFTQVTPYNADITINTNITPVDDVIQQPSLSLATVNATTNETNENNFLTSKVPTQETAIEQLEQNVPSTSQPQQPMSPDLISSTSTLDVNKVSDILRKDVTVVTESPLSGGAGDASFAFATGSKNLETTTSIKTSSAQASPHGSAHSSVLLPVSPTTWPKAPDVTMFHRTSHRTSPSSSREDLQVAEASSLQPNPRNDQAQDNQPAISDIVAMVQSLQTRQEDLFRANQRETTKKHNQLVKSVETSLKRIETQQNEKYDRLLKSTSDRKTASRGEVEALARKFDASLKNEVKNVVLPSMVQALAPLSDGLHNTLASKLTATNVVLKESIGKLVRSKETIEAIGNTTGRIVQSQMVATYRDTFINTVLPAFERSCQSMFQQLAIGFQSGIDEAMTKLDNQMQTKLLIETERLESVVREAKSVTQQLKETNAEKAKNVAAKDEFLLKIKTEVKTMQQQMMAETTKNAHDMLVKALQEQRSMLEGCIITINEKLSSVPKHSSKPDKSSSSRKLTYEEQQQQILSLLQQGHVNSAFQRALSAADLNLVMCVCEMVDPSKVFGSTPSLLQQPILLSLVQQLSCDLDTNTELKLKYLKEAVMNLDPEHQVIKDHLKPILETLVKNLAQQSSRPATPTGSHSSSNTIVKDMKMLAMAAQSLIH